MKKTLLFLLLAPALILTKAQDIDDFSYFGDDYEDQRFISLGLNQVKMTNDKAPNPENHITKGFTLKLDLKYTDFEKGGMSVYYEHKLLGDLIWWGARFFGGKKEEFYQQEESGLSSGLLGHVTGLWNITDPDKYQIAIGANFRDIFLTSAYPEDETKPYSNPNNNTVLEPSGSYFAIGPSLGARYNLANIVLIEYRSDLSIPFGKVDPSGLVDVDNFKNPYFFNHVLELNSSKGFFVGYEYTSFIERSKAANSTNRTELYVGFRIRL